MNMADYEKIIAKAAKKAGQAEDGQAYRRVQEEMAEKLQDAVRAEQYGAGEDASLVVSNRPGVKLSQQV